MKTPAQGYPDCHILHVDDNEDDAFLFQRALEKISFAGSYEWVDSAAQAVARLKEETSFPTLIVTDGIRAIGPNGLDFIRQTVPAEVPIIVYSGDLDPRSMDEALSHGAVGYLHKKSTFEESVLAVSRILQLCHREIEL